MVLSTLPVNRMEAYLGLEEGWQDDGCPISADQKAAGDETEVAEGENETTVAAGRRQKFINKSIIKNELQRETGGRSRGR